MPDASGALTPQDHETVKAWFAEHWQATVTCPVCMTSNWGYGTHVLQLNRYAADGRAPGSLTFPYLPVFCQVCGHTMFFGATTVGITSAYAPPAAPTT